MFVNSAIVQLMAETELHFSDVTFGFGKRNPLFDGLSCVLANTSNTGKIIALMGPSGVGKSTFCDLALGIRQPQKGAISFAPGNANIAMIPQKAVIFDELSVEENIACLRYSKTLGHTFQKDKVQSAADSLGLADVLRNATRVSALSGGEAQRVMLARIQTINCDVLILDEPCSFLDNRVKGSFLTALRATVDDLRLLALMVTHVWDEARMVADEVLFFYQAPGQAISLHRCTIAEAESHPPTIDAMYGIHWPDCLILDLVEDAPFAGIPSEGIPHDARYLSLFHDGQNKSAQDHWVVKLWSEAKKSSIQNGRMPQVESPDTAAGLSLTCVYYNADGFLINDTNTNL